MNEAGPGSLLTLGVGVFCCCFPSRKIGSHKKPSSLWGFLCFGEIFCSPPFNEALEEAEEALLEFLQPGD